MPNIKIPPACPTCSEFDDIDAHGAFQRLRRHRKTNLWVSKMRTRARLDRQRAIDAKWHAKRAGEIATDLSKMKLEMRLLGIETESATRELYTFECTKCGALEVRGVKISKRGPVGASFISGAAANGSALLSSVRSIMPDGWRGKQHQRKHCRHETDQDSIHGIEIGPYL